MTNKSLADLDMLNELIARKSYLTDLEPCELVDDLKQVEMPQFLINDIVAYVPTLIKHYDAEIDKAAKVFVETWLANDGGNHNETTD